MRPQHITAENRGIPDATRPEVAASMRPQHITAENSVAEIVHVIAARHASMRPQHITAENLLAGAVRAAEAALQ